MTKTIFLVESERESEIQQIKSNIEKNNNAKIISLNYRTHKNLSKHKIDHEIGELYLNESDLIAIDDYTIKITSEWYKDPKISQQLIFDNIEYL